MNKIENFDQWRCRCSSLGRIVTKSGKLTDDSKTYLTEVFIGELYGVRREAYGRQLDKGIACEVDGLEMLRSVFYPNVFIPKLKEPIMNEFVKGTPDTSVDGVVIDIKNAFDLFSFGKIITGKLPHNYEKQLNGYAFAGDYNVCRLFYCLNNMPEYMVADEERKMFYTQKKWVTTEDPDYLEACEKLRAAHNYDHMDVSERFHFWEWERTNETDQEIIDAVVQSREFLNGLLMNELKRKRKNMLILNTKGNGYG